MLAAALPFSGRVVSSETVVVTHLQSKYSLCPCVDLCLFIPDISLRVPRAVSSQSPHRTENSISAYCLKFSTNTSLSETWRANRRVVGTEDY